MRKKYFLTKIFPETKTNLPCKLGGLVERRRCQRLRSPVGVGFGNRAVKKAREHWYKEYSCLKTMIR